MHIFSYSLRAWTSIWFVILICNMSFNNSSSNILIFENGPWRLVITDKMSSNFLYKICTEILLRIAIETLKMIFHPFYIKITYKNKSQIRNKISGLEFKTPENKVMNQSDVKWFELIISALKVWWTPGSL